MGLGGHLPSSPPRLSTRTITATTPVWRHREGGQGSGDRPQESQALPGSGQDVLYGSERRSLQSFSGGLYLSIQVQIYRTAGSPPRRDIPAGQPGWPAEFRSRIGVLHTLACARDRTAAHRKARPPVVCAIAPPRGSMNQNISRVGMGEKHAKLHRSDLSDLYRKRISTPYSEGALAVRFVSGIQSCERRFRSIVRVSGWKP